jgi:hypothetical protein
MASNAPVKVDKKELEKAQAIWGNFMQATKYGIVAIVIILAGLAVSFISLSS